MPTGQLTTFIDELEKISAAHGRMHVPKSRVGRRPISVARLLAKEKDGTLFKNANVVLNGFRDELEKIAGAEVGFNEELLKEAIIGMARSGISQGVSQLGQALQQQGMHGLGRAVQFGNTPVRQVAQQAGTAARSEFGHLQQAAAQQALAPTSTLHTVLPGDVAQGVSRATGTLQSYAGGALGRARTAITGAKPAAAAATSGLRAAAGEAAGPAFELANQNKGALHGLARAGMGAKLQAMAQPAIGAMGQALKHVM